MQPSEFWGTDTWSVMDAYEGFAMSKGIKKSGGKALSAEEVDELKTMMAEEERRMARLRDGHR